MWCIHGIAWGVSAYWIFGDSWPLAYTPIFPGGREFTSESYTTTSLAFILIVLLSETACIAIVLRNAVPQLWWTLNAGLFTCITSISLFALLIGILDLVLLNLADGQWSPFVQVEIVGHLAYPMILVAGTCAWIPLLGFIIPRKENRISEEWVVRRLLFVSSIIVACSTVCQAVSIRQAGESIWNSRTGAYTSGVLAGSVALWSSGILLAVKSVSLMRRSFTRRS